MTAVHVHNHATNVEMFITITCNAAKPLVVTSINFSTWVYVAMSDTEKCFTDRLVNDWSTGFDQRALFDDFILSGSIWLKRKNSWTWLDTRLFFDQRQLVSTSELIQNVSETTFLTLANRLSTLANWTLAKRLVSETTGYRFSTCEMRRFRSTIELQSYSRLDQSNILLNSH